MSAQQKVHMVYLTPSKEGYYKVIKEKAVKNLDRTSKVFFRVMMFSLQTSTLFKVTWEKNQQNNRK